MTTSNKSGFTLLELLIVILIIGLLSAISIPMYKKAVEKSKVADALSTMQAVSKSEHGWYLVRNNYTKDFANLDIDLYDKDGNKAEDEILEGINYTYELLDTGILATRTNGEYSIYQDYDTKQIMCTPGTHFICDDLGAFTKEPCEKANLTWANTNSTCYANEEARCKGLYDDETWNGEFCGYTNTTWQTIGEGMECLSDNWDGCRYSTITSGGQCVVTGTANDRYGCMNSIINNGGVCEANAGHLGCAYSTVSAGGKCIGTGYKACEGVWITNGGICEGRCNYAIINEGGICKGDCRGSTVNNGGICTGGCSGSTINDGGKCICDESISGACECKRNTYYGTGCCEGYDCRGWVPRCDCPIDPETGQHKKSC